MTSIEIPASVTNIGQWAFGGCTSYGYGAFYNNADGRKIYVFKNCLDTYKERAWKTDDDWGMGFYEDDFLPIESINLKDNDENSSLIAAANEYAPAPLNVTLKDRTLYKDGAWNTLCLPFSLASLTGTPLAGATVKELLTTSNLDGEGVLTLNFSDNLTAIEAGKPYIVKWSKDAGYDANPSNFDLVNPVFNGVTVSDDTNNVAFTGGSFKGTYEKMAFEAEDKSILFVGAGNNLYWPKPSGDNIPSLGACRAYFQLDFDAVGPGGGGVREFVLNFGDEEQPLSISPVGERTEAFPQEGLDGVWYSLDGCKLSGKPTQKGLYIHGGKKVVIP